MENSNNYLRRDIILSVSKLIKMIHTNKIGLFLGLSALVVILVTCVEPFDPEISEYESALVVEGTLTNIPGSCRVILSRSYPYNDNSYQRVSEASVKLIDDLGNETDFKYYQNGIYKIDDETFAGEIGRKYKIYVTTNRGEECESLFEELKNPVPIDSLYFKFVDRPHYSDQGVQIYLDMHDPENQTFYYSWDYVETWEFAVPYTSPHIENSQTCYRNYAPYTFNIATTIENTSDALTQYPLTFVNNSTNRLSIKYSLLVRQYTLSDRTYNFRKALKEVNEEGGSLFDKVPETSLGNIINLTDSDLPVLGNFQVSGVSEKRMFIRKTDLPDFWVPTEFEYCMHDIINTTQKALIDSLLLDGWSIIDTLPASEYQPSQYEMAFNYDCFDCKTNGSNERPSFWNQE